MIGAGKPQRVEAGHPLPAHDDVLQRVHERVADVQTPGDVRRRDDDGEFRPLRIIDRSEILAALPEVVDALLELRGLVAGGEVLSH